MGLYDNYQLANSSRIKQYQGSTVPELVKVSQELQGRYDAAIEGQDYVSRFMKGMQALPGDKAALGEMAGEYNASLKKLAGRPDQENALRETTMLARDVPAAYAPFAQRIKDASEYKEQLDKDVREGKINTQTASRMLAMSQYQDKGLTKDPMTGRYTGRFTGAQYVKDINMTEKVDKWMTGHAEHVTGHQVEKVGDQWMIKSGSKRTQMTPEMIKRIISTGASADQEFQAWSNQQQDLATYDKDYSKMDPSKINMDTQMGSYSKKEGKKSVEVPITLREVVKGYTDKGYTVGDALKAIHRGQVGNQNLSEATNYALTKYTKDDIETTQDVSANPYGLQQSAEDAKNSVIPIAATLFQPSLGSEIMSAVGLDKKIKEADDATRNSYDQLTTWTQKNGIKAVGANGQPASPFSPTARFFDGSGVEKTFEARKFIDGQQQAAIVGQQLDQKKKSAMKRAGFTDSPELQSKAQADYDEVYADMTKKSKTRGAQAAGGITQAEITSKAQSAYDNVYKNDPKYQEYQRVLEMDAKSDVVPVGISTFKNDKLNKAIESTFSSLALNLDNDGLAFGTQGLTWASGPDAGKQMSADDYKKIVGTAKYAGSGIDVDGQYKQFFKVGTGGIKDGKAVGEDVLVKMPAYTGIAQNLVKEGQITPAQQYIGQSLSSLETSPVQSTVVKVGKDMDVKVRKVLPSEKAYLQNNPGTNYVLTYEDGKGGVTEVPATSVGAATNHIIEVLKAHTKSK